MINLLNKTNDFNANNYPANGNFRNQQFANLIYEQSYSRNL